MASTSTTAGQPDTEITSAFDGIAPTSASASASACSSKPPYDIFLNHRGPDVKHTLASDIYDALSAMGFKVFLDSEELDLGDFLPEAIHQAMHTASLHIGILSRRYAQSPWCLAELSFMLKTGTPIIPIFYHVQPDDARWVAKGKGIYVDAFSEHVKKGRYTTQKLDEWKTALHNVSYYTGEIINDNDDMKRVLKNIENRVRKAMKTVPFEAAKHLVCLNEAVKDFESIAPQSGQTQVVGIWGMGGSGKITLAKELYNQKHSSMQASSFVFDVRDAAASKKLHKKQKKLLQDLGAKDLSFDNIEEGKVILSSRLRSVRVLVVLDDVDHGNQLDALLPTRDGLGRGSLIIVTTRDKEVLRSWDNSTIYKMRTLTHFHAQQLFCWHAFLRPYPLSGFEDLVMKFVDACDGLPLSLKVLGGQLYRESRKEIWQGLLQKISLLVEKDVKQCLKVSYEALDVQDQEAFLDTACFFNGVEKSLAIAVLDESGCGLICWERLVNKCLVEVEDDGLIRMHDHLRDLGREIAASQLPCRLWSPAQIMENQIRGQEKIEIRGMVSEIGRALAEQHDLSSDMKLMIKMDTRPEFCGVKRRRLLLNVKIFVVDGDYFNEQMAKVSRELVWLRWSEISHRSLPLWLPFKNLRVLELNGAKNLEELWEDGTDVPVLLRELVIDDCWEFRRFPSSIGFLKHLRKIVLLLNRMTNLPEEFCHLQSLEVLSLSGSIMLSSLPNNFGHLTNLRILNLSDSYELRTLPVTFKQLTFLQHLNLGGCEKLALESDILENMTNLQYLKLSGCRELKDLPLPITNQASLGELHLMDTRLRELPINIGQLSKLRQMQIGSPLLTSFPASIGNLSSLTSLQIHHCDNLESLPTSLENLSSLKSLDISLCIKLESLPHSVAHLIHLLTLKISYCPISKLEFGRGSFSSSLCNLNSIILSNTRVGTISIFEDRCPGIQNLKLLQNHHLTEVEELPTTVKHIEFINCEMLKKIRINGDLLNLETLIVVNCPELHMLPSFVGSTGLKCFEVRGCSKVEKIEGLQNCTSLEKLVADTCIEEVLGIRSLEYMDNLRTLNFKSNKRSIVQHCIQTIQKWPEEVVICSKAATEADAGSILNLSAFSNLFVVDSFANMKLSYPKLQQKHASNAGAIMLCYVLNCVSPHMIFGIDVRSGSRLPSESRIPLTVVDAGKWVYMCIFTQRSTFLKGKEFQIFQQFSGKPHPKFGDNEVEKGVLAIGDKKRVEDAFHQLLTLVKN